MQVQPIHTGSDTEVRQISLFRCSQMSHSQLQTLCTLDDTSWLAPALECAGRVLSALHGAGLYWTPWGLPGYLVGHQLLPEQRQPHAFSGLMRKLLGPDARQPPGHTIAILLILGPHAGGLKAAAEAALLIEWDSHQLHGRHKQHAKARCRLSKMSASLETRMKTPRDMGLRESWYIP